MLKNRVTPEDITINIDKDAPVPPCIPGHSWGDVVHKSDVTWTACWTDNVQGGRKYVRPGQSSFIKGVSDYAKFENARLLASKYEGIVADYTRLLDSSSLRDRDVGLVAYIIDKTAIRMGNPKGSDKADTVGGLTLRREHVTPATKDGKPLRVKDELNRLNIPVPPMRAKGVRESGSASAQTPSKAREAFIPKDKPSRNSRPRVIDSDSEESEDSVSEEKEEEEETEGMEVETEGEYFIKFDFLGKDSVPYINTVPFSLKAYSVMLRHLAMTPSAKDRIFQCTSSNVNDYLQSLMPGLTAKVFRTYHSSSTQDRLLARTTGAGSVNDRYMQYQAINREVAILCNHQRNVAKGHDTAAGKADIQHRRVMAELAIAKLQVLRCAKQMAEAQGLPGLTKTVSNRVAACSINRKSVVQGQMLADGITGAIAAERRQNLINRLHKKEQERRVRVKKAEERGAKIPKDDRKPYTAENEDGTIDLLVSEAQMEHLLKSAKQLQKEKESAKPKKEAADKPRLSTLQNLARFKESAVANGTAASRLSKMAALIKKMDTLKANLDTLESKRSELDLNKNIALGTSRTNYLDPRITVAWCKRARVPLSKIYTRTLMVKFPWALDVEADWRF
ncbi:DNA topoisomerase I [Kipferlia bialata]|uniref:DNA topoisomerase 1 n=1 Tax=Kipferlia bialata TaxID=797122 RepID=A0A9K3GIF2_9EUKA|nr:DNA topoisomerase I [Kipferlia bialata]|eukprot:g6783.t1